MPQPSLADSLEHVTFLGASLEQWAVAAGVALLAFLALSIMLRVVLHRLRRLAESSTNTLDDAIVEVLSRTNPLLLGVMCALIGVGMVELSPSWHRRVDQLWFIALALQFGFWGSRAIRIGLRRYIARNVGSSTAHTSATATLMSWGLRTALWTVVVLAILSNVGINITAFVASLGVGGIAVALAVQNILGDLFASLSIAIDKPFEVGDFVVVNGVAGTIELVGLKSTRIRSLGGEQVVMSNTDLLKQTISNYKRLQERRIVYNFGITYDTTPEQAEQVPKVVERIVRARERLRFDRAHFTGFGDSSLDYELVYYVLSPEYNVHMDEKQAVSLGLMRELQALGVEFAFPTRTVHVVGSPPPAATAAP